MKIHLLTLVLIFGCFYLVFPTLSSDLSDYRKESNILIGSEIHKTEHVKLFSTRTSSVLVLKMENGLDWEINNTYSSFWKELRKEEYIGKEIILYDSYIGSERINPVQIEIDGIVIYGVNEIDNLNYSILLLTLVCCVCSGYKLYQFIVKYY